MQGMGEKLWLLFSSLFLNLSSVSEYGLNNCKYC